MNTLMLSSKSYKESKEHDFGDCFISDNGNDVVVFDCGSNEHAEKVIEYLENNYGPDKKAIVFLSHNDSDHFNGIPKLIEKEKVEKVYTILFLKLYHELLDKIDDGRKTNNSIKEQIAELYSNITSLEGQGILFSIYDNNDSFVKVCNGINIVGPTKEYALKAAAKALDSCQGNTLDKETVINAASVQLSIAFGTSKMLLTGDSSTDAIQENVKTHQIIQIPHHGRLDHAEDLFEIKKYDKDTVYLISDNKGSSSGGSEELISKGKNKGHTIFNTRTEDTKTINSTTYQKSYRMGSYI